MPSLFIALIFLTTLTHAKEPVGEIKDAIASEYALKLAPEINPKHLDKLTGKRAGTPYLRRACFILESSRLAGAEPKTVIEKAHKLTGPHPENRTKEQQASLLLNLKTPRELGCLNEEGMGKLKTGNAPTISKGKYKGELATADHLLPRSIVPELRNRLFNLQFMPSTLNQEKGNKITEIELVVGERWHLEGLLSKEGIEEVLSRVE